MARVKRGVTAHKRHKRLLSAAEGRMGAKSRLVKASREASLHAMAYATRDRKQRKRQMRELWIVRINAAARQNGMTYGAFVAGLKKADIALDRKTLADVAVRDAGTFTRIVEDVRGAALEARLQAEAVDVTTPGRPIRRGALHPIMETIREIAEIFGQFGFVTYEGPEVEDDLTNFQMLNIPPDHPARDLWDTLYVDIEGQLLRTHTSPGQIRVMTSAPPPIRALLPGRCYRYEAIDASHASEFFQVEGLMVDEGTTMADLKGLLDQFAKAMYGADKKTRFRPGYYPFTEPPVAFDIKCLACGGRRCPACSHTGWLTILGA